MAIGRDINLIGPLERSGVHQRVEFDEFAIGRADLARQLSRAKDPTIALGLEMSKHIEVVGPAVAHMHQLHPGSPTWNTIHDASPHVGFRRSLATGHPTHPSHFSWGPRRIS